MAYYFRSNYFSCGSLKLVTSGWRKPRYSQKIQEIHIVEYCVIYCQDSEWSGRVSSKLCSRPWIYS